MVTGQETLGSDKVLPCLSWNQLTSANVLKIFSGDGTLSVIDVRSNKTAPFAQSEDQEDELLSAVTIKGSVDLFRDAPLISQPIKWTESCGRNPNGNTFNFQPEKWLG